MTQKPHTKRDYSFRKFQGDGAKRRVRGRRQLAYFFEEALKLKQDFELRWLIVKREKQLDDADINSALRRLAKRFEPEFTRFKRLRDYDVYQRP